MLGHRVAMNVIARATSLPVNITTVSTVMISVRGRNHFTAIHLTLFQWKTLLDLIDKTALDTI